MQKIRKIESFFYWLPGRFVEMTECCLKNVTRSTLQKNAEKKVWRM